MCPNYSLPLYKELLNKYNEDTVIAIHTLFETPEFISWKGDTELPMYISKLNVVKNNKGEYLKSDDPEIFLKSFSLKTEFDRTVLSKFQLKQEDLIKTDWFRAKIEELLSL